MSLMRRVFRTARAVHVFRIGCRACGQTSLEIAGTLTLSQLSLLWALRATSASTLRKATWKERLWNAWDFTVVGPHPRTGPVEAGFDCPRPCTGDGSTWTITAVRARLRSVMTRRSAMRLLFLESAMIWRWCSRNGR